MAPKHKSPTDRRRTARAPYNFVSMPDKVLAFDADMLTVNQSQYHGDRLTGWIDLTMTTKSPMFVRGPLTPKQHEKAEKQDKGGTDKTPHLDKERNRPEFFHHGNPENPVIPGSSIRGMIRTICEVLAHGQFGPVSKNAVVFRAVGDTSSQGLAYRDMLMAEPKKNQFEPRYKAGFVRKDGDQWFIEPAAEVNGATFARIPHAHMRKLVGAYARDRIDRIRWADKGLQRWNTCKNAYEVYVDTTPYAYQDVRGGFLKIKYSKVKQVARKASMTTPVQAVLNISGNMNKKASETVVFVPTKTARDSWIEIPDGDGDDPRDLVTAYKDQISKEQSKLLGNNGALKNGQPVFYVLDRHDKLVFFGHTPNFRVPYQFSPADMLPSVHHNENALDLASAMFGKVKAKQGGIASRVSFSDAHTDAVAPWLPAGNNGVVIPKIMSGPKPTTFQHYLTQSRPDVERGKGLTTYADGRNKTTLRGYKMYWHKGNVQAKHFSEDERKIDRKTDTQHTQMRPVKADTQFESRIYYENLLPVELGLLLWALQLPTSGDFVHKLGMGKAHGLGAVKLDATLHIYNLKKRYASFGSDNGLEQGLASTNQAEKYRQHCIAKFEAFVLGELDNAPQRLAQLPRIRELLTMLKWAGDAVTTERLDATRYMEIEHPDPRSKRGKRNEYRDRPVLPGPLDVKF